jgi:hypothetical protein
MSAYLAIFGCIRGIVRRNALQREVEEAVPRVPERAHLPLLPSSPGGLGELSPHEGPENECTG